MKILLIEAFYGGSHKQLVDLLMDNIEGCVAYTLPAKKWHWRARTAALHFMQAIPINDTYRVLFTSSVLNLAELIALRPDLAKLKKILYFHENQLIYPVRKSQERDFQYGYNQVLSCLVADMVVFNSTFNMESFLTSISTFMKLIPDHRPKDLEKLIRPKCQVIYFPIKFTDVRRFLPDHKLESLSQRINTKDVFCHQPSQSSLIYEGCSRTKELLIENPSERGIEYRADIFQDGSSTSPVSCQNLNILEGSERTAVSPEEENNLSDRVGGTIIGSHRVITSQKHPLHIVWPHRWEHDKDPEVFFKIILKLKEKALAFQVSVLGETFTDVPAIFAEARKILDGHIAHWGYIPSKDDYIKILCEADVVVSTARHEFFGVAMLEAVYCGCYPLCPKALVYPEIFPAEYLYSTPEQLFKRLQTFCTKTDLVRKHHVKVDMDLFSWANLSRKYRTLLTAEAKEDL
ncbi:glycosyltransferase-like domain-containing protein 1 isoform X1 [Polypterus senegalus]|uniref:glycosyltransferase-like domain-containing protein 1 isoform X1 n=1 Tax=Polypterus senegalus TaxID=55291 RepID=UPI001963C7DD|nr:glycosyltransferase-like domain-containing protein 1 isoform X1 [Polypterus senegalus]